MDDKLKYFEEKIAKSDIKPQDAARVFNDLFLSIRPDALIGDKLRPLTCFLRGSTSSS
jgi:hypothetical protein